MTYDFPMMVLATLGEVTVFQTAAFTDADMALNDIASINCQSMRQVGQPSYGKGNIGLHVNDDAVKVLDNRMHLLATINQHLAASHRSPIESLHWVNQVHGKQIYDVDTNPLIMQPVDADALVSPQSNVGLAVMTADCVPIVLYQPTTGKIAAIHAGWQGLACGVIKATVERFTQMGQITAWIGACISQENYEVNGQVSNKLLAGCISSQLLADKHIQQFSTLFCNVIDTNISDAHTLDANIIDTDMAANSQGAVSCVAKVHINLPKLAHYQLLHMDVTVANEGQAPCSYADGRHYSYRRQTHLQQPATGRMALIIARSKAL
ncbi:polyphenol oxidase family protein [Psychrobacter sp. 16-MNA-CIBAN-0192]|uniref:polyphenol oxidase family protein n=1 Tax=Psychrobacter sp. 16-MNA-CIBAN-0192 TaxID=3140448 RepID=UPI0033252DE9